MSIIEAKTTFAEKTLEFSKRTVLTFSNRVICLEDLGSHVLMIVGKKADSILSTIKKIRKKAGI